MGLRSNIPSAPLAYQSGVTATAGEVNYNDITTVGTVQATKAVIVDGSKDVTGFNDLTGVTLTGSTSVNSPLVNAGADADAGEVVIYPATTASGKTTIASTDNAGDTETAVVVAAQAGARTYTIPDALVSASFLLGKQSAVARTATADGLTTGTIADGGMFQFISVTAKSGDAAGIIILPTPTPGTVIMGYIGATGCELRSSDPGTIAINGGTGASAESAIAANMFFMVVCTSATTWMGLTLTGTTLASMEAAA